MKFKHNFKMEKNRQNLQ